MTALGFFSFACCWNRSLNSWVDEEKNTRNMFQNLKTRHSHRNPVVGHFQFQLSHETWGSIVRLATAIES